MSGERGASPRGPLSTVALVLTGVLPALRLSSLVARSLFGLVRPMTLSFSGAGLSVCERLELSGRVLVERQRWIPRENLARISREVRHSGLGLYAGMLALLAGTYLGVQRVIDGAAVVSPTLIGSGLLLLMIGVGLDFALWRGSDAVRRTCRIVVVPRRGRAFSCRGLDPSLADEALRTLTAEATPQGSPTLAGASGGELREPRSSLDAPEAPDPPRPAGAT